MTRCRDRAISPDASTSASQPRPRSTPVTTTPLSVAHRRFSPLLHALRLLLHASSPLRTSGRIHTIFAVALGNKVRLGKPRPFRGGCKTIPGPTYQTSVMRTASFGRRSWGLCGVRLLLQHYRSVSLNVLFCCGISLG